MADRVVVMMIPNLFVRVPVDAAIRGAGGVPVVVGSVDDAVARRARVVVADLDAMGDDPAAPVGRLVGAGATVLAFGPHVHGDRLAAARRAGAVALPRSAFLTALPELLASALRDDQG